MNERRLTERLRDAAPVDAAARERAWRLVRAEHAARDLRARRPVRRWGAGVLAALLAGVTAVGVAAASAPDSQVGRWVRSVLGADDREVRPALARLPGGGRLLTRAGETVWVVSADGSRRRLGRYAGASWSPRGRFVVAWRGGVLTAVEPTGRPRWALSRPEPIAVARWAPVDGFRIAYLTGGELRVVNGDGSGDRRFGAAGTRVAPAWRPDGDHVLAHLDARGRVAVSAVDHDLRLWRSRRLDDVRQLEWSPQGDRLLAVTRQRLVMFDRTGAVLAVRRLPAGLAARSADWSPRRGGDLVVLRHGSAGGRSELVILDRALRRERRLFVAPGRLGRPEWSVDGDRLLVPWRAADQWLFLRPRAGGRLTAVAGIARQFHPGATRARFPAAIEWCCRPVRPRTG